MPKLHAGLRDVSSDEPITCERQFGSVGSHWGAFLVDLADCEMNTEPLVPASGGETGRSGGAGDFGSSQQAGCGAINLGT